MLAVELQRNVRSQNKKLQQLQYHLLKTFGFGFGFRCGFGFGFGFRCGFGVGFGFGFSHAWHAENKKTNSLLLLQQMLQVTVCTLFIRDISENLESWRRGGMYWKIQDKW